MSARGFVLAPSTASRAQGRSTRLNVVAHESRIGKQPVKLPDKVQVTIDGNTIKVKVSLDTDNVCCSLAKM